MIYMIYFCIFPIAATPEVAHSFFHLKIEIFGSTNFFPLFSLSIFFSRFFLSLLLFFVLFSLVSLSSSFILIKRSSFKKEGDTLITVKMNFFPLFQNLPFFLLLSPFFFFLLPSLSTFYPSAELNWN